MYTDPWDLKHSIQQLQEEQRYNKKLLSGQHISSTTYSSNLNQEIIPHHQYILKDQQHINNSQSNNHSQLNQQQNNNSDQNTTDKQRPFGYQHVHPKTLNNTYEKSHQVQFVPKHSKYNQNQRSKYGNLIVCFQSKNFLLSIGPNYIFFFSAYFCFTAASIYLIYLVNSSLQNVPFKIFNFTFCFLQNLSYLMVAFSNPGVKLPQKDMIMSSQKQQTKYCRKCNALMQRKTYHCMQCDICVYNYDHHCPWTSKCIGGGNLKRFYFFVCMTPFYIFYYVVAFMICMASLTVPYTKNIKPPIPTPTI